MSGARPLQTNVADLLRRPGVRRPLQRVATLDDLEVSTAAVPADAEVEVDLVLEATGGDVVAEGVVRAPWVGECRRCLEPVHDVLVADVREVFERHPSEGETYLLRDDIIDLESMVRDTVLLALPLAPLCGPDCAGPAPERVPVVPDGEAAGDDGQVDDAFTDQPPADARWAALDELRFDS